VYRRESRAPQYLRKKEKNSQEPSLSRGTSRKIEAKHYSEEDWKIHCGSTPSEKDGEKLGATRVANEKPREEEKRKTILIKGPPLVIAGHKKRSGPFD